MNPINLAAGEVLGGNAVFVGKYNGRANFATVTSPTAGGDNISIFRSASPRPATLQFIADPETKSFAAASTTCGQREIIGFADVDGAADGFDELVVFDRNLGNTSMCPGTFEGGFQVFKNGGPDAIFRRPASSAQGYGQISTLCDVNADGHADLVVVDGLTDGKASIYPHPFPVTNVDELDIGMAMSVPASPAGHAYNNARCARNFFFNAPATLLLIDPGDGATVNARVDLVQGFDTSIGQGVIRGVLQNPTPSERRFGTIYPGIGDFNGDGKGDLITGAAGVRYWSVFGR
jgi:hypothetical protein